MEIIRIFADDLHALYAVKYENVSMDEVERLLNLWTDIEFLENFFEENKIDLSYYKIDVEEAVIETLNQAKEIRKMLQTNGLSNGFIALHNTEYSEKELSKQKYKKRWLRFYAIKIENNTFLITGGTIKLTQLMNERPHTQQELRKLEMCKDFLRENGVFDNDSFNDFLELAF